MSHSPAMERPGRVGRQLLRIIFDAAHPGPRPPMGSRRPASGPPPKPQFSPSASPGASDPIPS